MAVTNLSSFDDQDPTDVLFKQRAVRGAGQPGAQVAVLQPVGGAVANDSGGRKRAPSGSKLKQASERGGAQQAAGRSPGPRRLRAGLPQGR